MKQVIILLVILIVILLVNSIRMWRQTDKLLKMVAKLNKRVILGQAATNDKLRSLDFKVCNKTPIDIANDYYEDTSLNGASDFVRDVITKDKKEKTDD